jgi:hypothetical protein
MTIGSPEHLALLADATGANGRFEKGTVTFNNTLGLAYETTIVAPSGYESVPMPMGSAIACALGSKFRVKLTDDTRWFHTWSAPGTPIDGSPGTSETFIPGKSSQQVAPGRKSERAGTLIGERLEWTGNAVGVL